MDISRNISVLLFDGLEWMALLFGSIGTSQVFYDYGLKAWTDVVPRSRNRFAEILLPA